MPFYVMGYHKQDHKPGTMPPPPQGKPKRLSGPMETPNGAEDLASILRSQGHVVISVAWEKS